MQLEFVNANKYRKQVRQLFVTAFPREERPPMWMMTRRCHQGKAEFSAVLDGDRFVGLTYVIGNDSVKTLMFLAIAEDARDGGYGSEILRCVHEKYGDTKIFLNSRWIKMLQTMNRDAEERHFTIEMVWICLIIRSERRG